MADLVEKKEKKERVAECREEERENTYREAPNDQICRAGGDQLWPPRLDLGLI